MDSMFRTRSVNFFKRLRQHEPASAETCARKNIEQMLLIPPDAAQIKPVMDISANGEEAEIADIVASQA
jgi:hypothetical protein